MFVPVLLESDTVNKQDDADRRLHRIYQRFFNFRNLIFYYLKPLIPRSIQIGLRRWLIRNKLPKVNAYWPIDEKAGRPPNGWKGWPEGRKFAFVLMHDVETASGIGKCGEVLDVEEKLGFRSAFYIVPEDYRFPPKLRTEIVRRGFELGVHGLRHDGKMFVSRNIFDKRAQRINTYLGEWNAKGFSSPSMHHNLSWMHALKITYDISTFDTDPFEPQPDGVQTIFPFIVREAETKRSYIELPYTLPQDFTLFVLMREKDISIWKKKIDWIAGCGGMALANIHPDYLNFSGRPRLDGMEYPVDLYIELLDYILSKYGNDCWRPLPIELARYYAGLYS